MKAVVAAFNQEKALVGAFSVIVQPVVEPMEHYTALDTSHKSHTARRRRKAAQDTAHGSGHRRTQNDVKCDEHMLSCEQLKFMFRVNTSTGQTLAAVTCLHTPACHDQQSCTAVLHGETLPWLLQHNSQHLLSPPIYEEVFLCACPGLETVFEACMCDLTWLTIMCHKSLLCFN